MSKYNIDYVFMQKLMHVHIMHCLRVVTVYSVCVQCAPCVSKGKNHLHVSPLLLSFQFLLSTEKFCVLYAHIECTVQSNYVCLCAKGTHVSFCVHFVQFCCLSKTVRCCVCVCVGNVCIASTKRVRVRQTSVRIDKIIIITHFVSKYKHFFKSHRVYDVYIFMLASHVTQLFLPTQQKQQQWHIDGVQKQKSGLCISKHTQIGLG